MTAHSTEHGMPNKSGISGGHRSQSLGIFFLVPDEIVHLRQAHAHRMRAGGYRLSECKSTETGGSHGITSFSMIWSNVCRLRIRASRPSVFFSTSAASGKEL